MGWREKGREGEDRGNRRARRKKNVGNGGEGRATDGRERGRRVNQSKVVQTH